jgi:rSAM/selenodomain-associated transferase 1
MSLSDTLIIVFTRAPRRGHCKTRLIPRLGALGAARLQQRMTQSMLAAAMSGGRTELWCAPDTAHGSFCRLRAETGARLRRQPSGDLGVRMARAIAQGLGDAKHVLLVGTDCPQLGPAELRAARAALDRHDVVLQAAADGGFVLIGTRKRLPDGLRGIRWSSGKEMAQTIARLRHFGYSLAILPARQDIDTPDDWRRARRSGVLGVLPGTLLKRRL